MTDVKAQKSKMRGIALVRNALGQPQFDNYDYIPETFHPHLNYDDWAYIRQRREHQNGNHT